MPPRDASVRGRGRPRGRGRGQGRGRVMEPENIPAQGIGANVPTQPEQGTRRSAVAEAQFEAEEVQSGAPEIPQPATLDTGAILQQLAATMAALAGGARTGSQPQASTGSTTLERFRRMKPPTYDGVADTEVADRFLDECEKILEAMEIVDPATRITLTAFQLVGRASVWWASIKGAGGAVSLGWEQFKERFRDHFFPQSLRDAKREEFATLIQGTLSVLEYERKFTDLSKYAPELIATSRLKCRKFERGLRPPLRSRIVPLGLEDYEMIINRAMTVEQDVNETRSIIEGRRGKSTRGP